MTDRLNGYDRVRCPRVTLDGRPTRALPVRDERSGTGGDHSSAIWRDERHRDAILAGIAAIEARA